MRLLVIIVRRHWIYTGMALLACALILPSAIDGVVAVMSGRLFCRQVDVVVDPGHGGVDPGANDQDTAEKDITLDIALRMRSLLVRYGLSVGLTRDSDTDCSGWDQLRTGRHQADLRARTRMINCGRAGISVHVNTSSDSRQKGALVFYSSGSSEGRTLAEKVLSQLALITDLNHPTPIPRTNLLVLSATRVPTVLVEIGFLSNPVDKSRMNDESFRGRIASAMAKALNDYFASSKALAKVTPN